MPPDAQEKATKEIERLETMPPMSAEATVCRNYLDWLISLPWNKKSREKRDLKSALKILDEDHYGLEKVKERIIEYLSIRQLVKNPKGVILGLIGPPGVGKSSLGRSIARATGRKFVRLSLGGVRDEAEIRGHRRTYIGAYPGRIIQMIKRGGTKNPVFLLDEVDKMSMDFRGDPASALMEVLDPDQNGTFLDHYIDTDFDLSQVMFIVTANMLDPIPRPLIDRMEIIRLPGYTEDEKLQIAKRFLVPRQLKAHGLKANNLKIADPAMQKIIREYTREAGVRNLEREITSVCRKLVKRVVDKGKEHGERVTSKNLEGYLGIAKYRRSLIDKAEEVGASVGMAWTEFGGELLTFEATKVHGKGSLHPDRTTGRDHAGIGPGGLQLRPGEDLRAQHRQGPAQELRHPYSRPGRGHAQGRAVRRHHHRHGDHLTPDGDSGQPQGGHDRRDHAPGTGPAGRRDQGKAPGGPPRRHPRGHRAAR